MSFQVQELEVLCKCHNLEMRVIKKVLGMMKMHLEVCRNWVILCLQGRGRE